MSFRALRNETRKVSERFLISGVLLFRAASPDHHLGTPLNHFTHLTMFTVFKIMLHGESDLVILLFLHDCLRVSIFMLLSELAAW